MIQEEKYSNQKRQCLFILFVTFTVAWISIKTNNPLLFILALPIDVMFVYFMKTIIFTNEKIFLNHFLFPNKRNRILRFSDIILVSPLTKPAGFRIKIKSEGSMEFFFKPSQELKNFYRLLIINKVQIDTKEFDYLIKLIASVKKDIAGNKS